MKLRALTLSWLAVAGVMVSHGNGAAMTSGTCLFSTVVAAQENSSPAPKLEEVTLVNINFGSNASLVIKNSEGQQRTIALSTDAKYYNDKSTGSLTKFAQDELNRTIHIQTQRINGVVRVSKAWDAESYTKWVSEHQGSRNGQVSGFYPKALLIGDQFYVIDESTEFVAEGKTVARRKLKDSPVLWVKCVVKNGVAVAARIADTSESLGIVVTGDSSRPRSDSRPKSTGRGSGSPTEDTRNPGERKGKERPASSGSKSLSPTERAAQAARGYLVTVVFTITDPNDNPQGSEPAEVAEGVARGVGVHDDTVEVFGHLKFNSETRWEIKRDDAEKNKKIKNEQVKPKDGSLPSFLVKAETLLLTGSLMDRDALSRDDLLFNVDLNLDLYKASLQGQKEYKTRGGKATMVISVVAK